MSMHSLVLAATATLIGLAILVRSMTGGKGKPPRYPYQKQLALFSVDDQTFYRGLRQAMGDDYEIFGKIRISDLILTRKGTPRTEARLAFHPIAGRHFDFVLCDKNNLTVVCAIQLTDKSDHTGKAGPDNPLKAVCDAVSLPFVSFHSRTHYSPDEMREQLYRAMSKEPFYLLENDGRREPHISNLDDIKF